MASENINCIHCENYQASLIEKEDEIKKLKIQIQNLTNYLLWQEKISDKITDADVKTKYDLNQINKTTRIFFTSEIFITSCDILSECAIFESKSVQTENNEYSHESSENYLETSEIPESETGNMHDYVYDKNYNMYYSLSTGYYYDEKSGLMYEPQSCTYYKYNYDKKEYEKISEGEYSTFGETQNNESEDVEEANYDCEVVVNQVNNLNLNDDSNKTEKSDSEINLSNTLESESSTNENENSDKSNLKTSSEDESLSCSPDWQPPEGSKLTVTDMVKQVVDEHNNMSDYVYDESSQMYYSPSTGYYYDAVRKLLYEPSSGIYYFYDDDKQTYEFYYQTETCTVDQSKSDLKQNFINKERLTSRKLYWKKKLHSKQTSEMSSNITVNDEVKVSEDVEGEFSSPEDGEIFSSDEEDTSASHTVSIIKSPVKGPCLNKPKSTEEYPPSIRAIVENSENLQVGSLILITCSGGVIGRDKINAVYIPDVCVSKLHAEVKYNSDCLTYSIEDLGSQNGTFINDKRLSAPKLKSEPCLLSHGDKLSLGSCKLLLHIHDGHDTCDGCEPGQVLAEISSNVGKNAAFITKDMKEKLRRDEVRRLKKKYGLQGSDFERKAKLLTAQGYEDKSEMRRKTVGSDNPYEKTQEASVDISMPETNKGYQMLKKMGWKEGQTLGTSDLGLTEPIPLRPWTSKAGLGSSGGDPSSSVVSLHPQDRRIQKWVKARERYLKLSLGNDAS